MNRISFILFAWFLGAGSGLTQELAWVRQMGGTNSDNGQCVVADSDGNAYITGRFGNSATFGNVHLDGKSAISGYIAKITSKGDVDWANSFGDTNGVAIGGVAVDPAGFVYVTGTFFNSIDFGSNHFESVETGSMSGLGTDIFLAKYTLDGAVVWARRFGGTDTENCTGIYVDQRSNVYLSGTYRLFSELGNFKLPGNGMEHVWVARLNADGEVQWASSVGSEIWLYSDPKVTADIQGNVYVAGGFIRSISFPKETLIGRPNDHRTMYLAKYDSSGSCLWARSGGGKALGLIADAEGNVYVTGSLRGSWGEPYAGTFDNVEISGNNDCYLAQYDTSGHLVWVKNEGGSSIALGVNSDLYVSEQLEITRTFGGQTFNATGYLDIFVGRYDKAGNPIKAWLIGDLETESAGGVCLDKFGSVYTVGTTFHSTDRNNYGLTNYGYGDVLVARLGIEGPMIIRQPQKLTLFQGSNAVFSVQVTNAVAAHFQWQRNGVPISDDNRISGSTTDTLVINAVEVLDEADYSVRITADNGQVVSSISRLRIEGIVKFINAELGSYGAFMVTFSGFPGHVYDVEVSTNFQNWNFLTNGFCIKDTMTVSDYGVTNVGSRFYRAVAH